MSHTKKEKSIWNTHFTANDWYEDFPTCNGTSQSPINIDHEMLVSADYSNFSFSVGYKVVQKGILVNNGHTGECKSLQAINLTSKWSTNQMMTQFGLVFLQFSLLLMSHMQPVYLVGLWRKGTSSTNSIYIGEVSQAKDPSTQLTVKGCMRMNYCKWYAILNHFLHF